MHGARIMTRLENISLVAVATQEIEATVEALRYSARALEFDEILLVSHRDPLGADKFYRHVPIAPFGTAGDWGRFVVFELHKHIHSNHIILVHDDGFIVNPEQWSEEFRNYDFIGAPFPLPRDSFSYRDSFGNIIRVGNSVSLRSKRLLKLPAEIGLRWDDADGGYFHEDGFLCGQHRHTLQAHGIVYPPLDIACRFSRETPLPEHKGIVPFAFHKWAGPNRDYPCFNPGAVRRKELRRIQSKLRSLIGP